MYKNKFLKLKFFSIFIFFLSSPMLYGQNIYVFDINDTITLNDSARPNRSLEGILSQLAAQDVKISYKENTISLEEYIAMKFGHDEYKQSHVYLNFNKYVFEWLNEGFLTKKHISEIEAKFHLYSETFKNIPKNDRGIFTSFKNVLKNIFDTDPTAIVLFQSFGNEIPLVLEAVQSWFPDLSVDMNIHSFDDKGVFLINGLESEQSVKDIGTLHTFLKPRSVHAWKNNYQAWKSGKHGKFLFYVDDSIKTYFFDDNAHIVGTILQNGKLLSKEMSNSFFDRYVLKVNTAHALIDPNYYIDAIYKMRDAPKLQEIYPIPTLPLHDRSLSVLSYNIQLSGLDEDGHSWHHERKTPVIELIKKHNPDLIGLQEVSHAQLKDLTEHLIDYKFYAINTTNNNLLNQDAREDQEGLVIFYKSKKFEVLEEKHWWLSETPHIPSKSWSTKHNKITQKLILKEIASGKIIGFYNSHFPHDGESLINPRYKSSELELKEIQQDIQNKVIPISVGDRNFHFPRDQKAYDLYVNTHGITDATIMNQFGANTTFMGYEGHTNRNLISNQGSFLKSYLLDLIFFGSDFILPLQTQILIGEYDHNGNIYSPDRVKNKADRRFASDHAAVLSIFKWKNL